MANEKNKTDDCVVILPVGSEEDTEFAETVDDNHNHEVRKRAADQSAQSAHE
ncbi:hypothetical protein ACFOLF_06945 [Paenibacillus sepulcri]|uniref:hypothetical protein n=1 Tax=Paenibacillus sepulcri TaxID=359917 RepID=UPI001AE99EEC